MELIERIISNNWILWSLFLAGFFVPQIFLIFLPSMGLKIYRSVTSEYKETAEYWKDKLDKRINKTQEDIKDFEPIIPAVSQA